MADLIDREKLLSTIKDMQYRASTDYPKLSPAPRLKARRWYARRIFNSFRASRAYGPPSRNVTARVILDTIKQMDAAEREPSDLRHGYWKKCKPGTLLYWQCSACENVHYLDEPRAAYCPGCGAKMDMEPRSEVR